jgi:hypothetical protein
VKAQILVRGSAAVLHPDPAQESDPVQLAVLLGALGRAAVQEIRADTPAFVAGYQDVGRDAAN